MVNTAVRRRAEQDWHPRVRSLNVSALTEANAGKDVAATVAALTERTVGACGSALLRIAPAARE